MTLRILAASALVVLGSCGPYAREGAPPPNYPAPPSGAAPSHPEPTPAKVVSVSIRVECRDSVNVFYGDNPKFGSGTSSRLGGNSVQSSMKQPGDMIWLIDEQRNGHGSATISETTREVTVTCTGISAE